jgi:CGNR zinc finger/Putative stress-induced transcription regulator
MAGTVTAGSESGEDFLLALLNSTPVLDGVPSDDLADPARGRAWLAAVGGLGTDAELLQVLRVRTALQAVVRGEQPPAVLAPELDGVTSVPAIADGRLTWSLSVAPERELAVRAILAWDALARRSPGRLRPCANDECRLFLIDRSKANAARWCSMAVCGNRMKARRHYQRAQHPQHPQPPQATQSRQNPQPPQASQACQDPQPPQASQACQDPPIT